MAKYWQMVSHRPTFKKANVFMPTGGNLCHFISFVTLATTLLSLMFTGLYFLISLIAGEKVTPDFMPVWINSLIGTVVFLVMLIFFIKCYGKSKLKRQRELVD